MISFEEAAVILDEAVESLPPEIFHKLNGGVNLVQRKVTDSNGFLIMGMYFRDRTGRRVELYYGSFMAFRNSYTPEKLKESLISTLKHELTHHIEDLAGDKSLEIWDAQQKSEMLANRSYDPLNAESVLFIASDDGALAPMAAAMLRTACESAELTLLCESAGLTQGVLNARAVTAAASYESDFSDYAPKCVSAELMERYDVVLCMTEAEALSLAERFEDFEEKIMCIGERDIAPPRLENRFTWKTTAERLAVDIDLLIRDLKGGTNR